MRIKNGASSLKRRSFSWSVDASTGIVSSKTKGSPRFQTVIGLEIHAQLDIATKLFSGTPLPKTSTLYQTPNTSVWPFDVGVPGVLPRVSREAVQAAVLSAAATKCQIPSMSRFERKHYFYADLPLGYQVTQQRWPLARDGLLQCQRELKKKRKKKGEVGESFVTRIERIQLEQDTGKTINATRNGITESLVDFNRAGCALIEIVFYPDLRSASDAATAVETLRSLLKHIGTCNGKMEEGSLRCDLNVSVAPIEQHAEDNSTDDNDDGLLKVAGNRVEVKNLNSIRQVQQAAQFEAVRQVTALMDGSPTAQETRTFDVKSGKTVVIRSKEGAKDYRFMPEPDLPPVSIDEDNFGGQSLESFLETTLPELPQDARDRLQREYGLSAYLSGVITGDPPAIEMFDVAVEKALSQLNEEPERVTKQVPEATANLLCNGLFALVREDDVKIKETLGEDNSVQFSGVNGKQLGDIVALMLEGSISNTMAKQLLKILHQDKTDKSARDIADENGFQLITDHDALTQLCRDVIADSPKEMERYKLGEKYAQKITKVLMGKAMGKSKGNAHPERLNEALMEVLEEINPEDE